MYFPRLSQRIHLREIRRKKLTDDDDDSSGVALRKKSSGSRCALGRLYLPKALGNDAVDNYTE